MTTLVTGATGMLGQALITELATRGVDTVGAARRKAALPLDLMDDAAVATAFETVRPETVINCAAATDVDACERDAGYAWAINARAVSILAQNCVDHDAKLVHISTDHFFAGDGDTAHAETAAVCLLNTYAHTKFAGEAFAQIHPSALVVRTNIVGFRGWTKPTFVEAVITMIERGEAITLFADAFASSIDTGRAAGAILDLLAADAQGVINLGAREVFSKKALIEGLAARLGYNLGHAETGSVHSLAIARADSLGLDVTKAEAILGRSLPTLSDVVSTISENYAARGKAA